MNGKGVVRAVSSVSPIQPSNVRLNAESPNKGASVSDRRQLERAFEGVTRIDQIQPRRASTCTNPRKRSSARPEHDAGAASGPERIERIEHGRRALHSTPPELVEFIGSMRKRRCAALVGGVVRLAPRIPTQDEVVVAAIVAHTPVAARDRAADLRDHATVGL